MTISHEQEQEIRDMLSSLPFLTVGLGERTREGTCSMAAINLALTNKLTDDVPSCMSLVIGRWLIKVQDCMPDELRNSVAWRELLPLAAGTGRAHEVQRCEMVSAWMWDAMAHVQGVADAHGFGTEWSDMLAAPYNSPTSVRASIAAKPTSYGAYCAARKATDLACNFKSIPDWAADLAVSAVDSVIFTCVVTWDDVDPVGLLRRLIAITDPRALA